jgi:hypothetical protein
MEQVLMSEDLNRLRQRREQVETQARMYRQREIAMRTKQRLEDDTQFEVLDTAAREARRTLQLNRLGVAQKRRSIKTMREKIDLAEDAMKPLLNEEPSLVDACKAAERRLDEYKRHVAADVESNLE